MARLSRRLRSADRFRRPNVEPPEERSKCVRRALHSQPAAVEHVGIDHRGLYALVPEEVRALAPLRGRRRAAEHQPVRSAWGRAGAGASWRRRGADGSRSIARRRRHRHRPHPARRPHPGAREAPDFRACRSEAPVRRGRAATLQPRAPDVSSRVESVGLPRASWQERHAPPGSAASPRLRGSGQGSCLRPPPLRRSWKSLDFPGHCCAGTRHRSFSRDIAARARDIAPFPGTCCAGTRHRSDFPGHCRAGTRHRSDFPGHCCAGTRHRSDFPGHCRAGTRHRSDFPGHCCAGTRHRSDFPGHCRAGTRHGPISRDIAARARDTGPISRVIAAWARDSGRFPGTALRGHETAERCRGKSADVPRHPPAVAGRRALSRYAPRPASTRSRRPATSGARASSRQIRVSSRRGPVEIEGDRGADLLLDQVDVVAGLLRAGLRRVEDAHGVASSSP